MKAISDEALINEIQERLEQMRISMKELTQLNQELAEANKKLSASEALKGHFLSHISNEIVNPFTSILGLAVSIQNMAPQKADKVKQLAGMIVSEASHLDFQLKNIFMAAALEAGDVEPVYTQTRLLPLVQDTLDRNRDEMLRQDILMSFTHSLPHDHNIITDPEKLDLIITNVVNNAMVFGGPSKTIYLHMEAKEGQVMITCRDEGPGILPDQIPRIFDRFYRADLNINSVRRGSGLGLSVSKSIAELMEMRILAENAAEGGSIFTLIMSPLGVETDHVIGYADRGNETIF